MNTNENTSNESEPPAMEAEIVSVRNINPGMAFNEPALTAFRKEKKIIKVVESADSISGKITVVRLKIKKLQDDLARDTATLKEELRKLKKLEKLNDQFNNL